MIERDRVLLRRLAQLNESIGMAVVDVLPGGDEGELSPDGLRRLALALEAVAADLRSRAVELDDTTEQPAPLVIPLGLKHVSGSVGSGE